MPTRRAILKAAGAISALASVPIAAQTGAPSPTPTPTPPPARPPDLLAKLARERYGKFLTEDELPLLDEDMAGLERRSARLRAYKLTNAEEPAVDFFAGRKGTGAARPSTRRSASSRRKFAREKCRRCLWPKSRSSGSRPTVRS